jgi:hypothetical protein
MASKISILSRPCTVSWQTSPVTTRVVRPVVHYEVTLFDFVWLSAARSGDNGGSIQSALPTTMKLVAFMALPSVTNGRPLATSTAANFTLPMSLQHCCFLSITHAPPCQDQIVSKSTCTCLSSSRSAVAAIIVRTFTRGKPSRQCEHDCDFSVQLPPSPTVSRTALPSQSRSST